MIILTFGANLLHTW